MAKFILKKTMESSIKKKLINRHKRLGIKIKIMAIVIIIETILILTTILSR